MSVIDCSDRILDLSIGGCFPNTNLILKGDYLFVIFYLLDFVLSSVAFIRYLVSDYEQ